MLFDSAALVSLEEQQTNNNNNNSKPMQPVIYQDGGNQINERNVLVNNNNNANKQTVTVNEQPHHVALKLPIAIEDQNNMVDDPENGSLKLSNIAPQKQQQKHQYSNSPSCIQQFYTQQHHHSLPLTPPEPTATPAIHLTKPESNQPSNNYQNLPPPSPSPSPCAIVLTSRFGQRVSYDSLRQLLQSQDRFTNAANRQSSIRLLKSNSSSSNNEETSSVARPLQTSTNIMPATSSNLRPATLVKLIQPKPTSPQVNNNYASTTLLTPADSPADDASATQVPNTTTAASTIKISIKPATPSSLSQAISSKKSSTRKIMQEKCRQLPVSVTALRLVPIQGEKKLLKTRNVGVNSSKCYSSIISKYMDENSNSTDVAVQHATSKPAVRDTNAAAVAAAILPDKKPVYLIPIVFVTQPKQQQNESQQGNVSFSIISQSQVQNQTSLNGISEQTLASLLQEIHNGQARIAKEEEAPKPVESELVTQKSSSTATRRFYFDDLDTSEDFKLDLARINNSTKPLISAYLSFMHKVSETKLKNAISLTSKTCSQILSNNNNNKNNNNSNVSAKKSNQNFNNSNISQANSLPQQMHQQHVNSENASLASMYNNNSNNNCDSIQQQQQHQPFIEPSTIELLDNIINSNSGCFDSVGGSRLNLFNENNSHMNGGPGQSHMIDSTTCANTTTSLVDYLSNLLQ